MTSEVRSMIDARADSALGADGRLELPTLSMVTTPTFDPGDQGAVAYDFYSWLRDLWDIPVLRPAPAGDENPFAEYTPFRVEPEVSYTKQELAEGTGLTKWVIRKDLVDRRVPTTGRSRATRYLGADVAELCEIWNRRRWRQLVVELFERLAPAPCGACQQCYPKYRRFMCVNYSESFPHRHLVKGCHAGLLAVLDSVRGHGGSFEEWWRQTGGRPKAYASSETAITYHHGIIVLYLLDRRLVVPSYEEMADLAFPGLPDEDLLRPWRNRRPEEYEALLRGEAAAGYSRPIAHRSRALLARFILLKHGLPGLAELARPLGPDAVRHAIRQERLVTMHLGHGVHLPTTLDHDIRAGHVILDEVRRLFWDHGAAKAARVGSQGWSEGPRGLDGTHIRALESVFAAPVWPAACIPTPPRAEADPDPQALLPLRPETDMKLPNPHMLRVADEAAGRLFRQLPTPLQANVMAYVARRHHEDRLALTTLGTEVKMLLSCLYWMHRHAGMRDDHEWWAEEFGPALRRYVAEEGKKYAPETIYNRLLTLAIFCRHLADLEQPYPPRFERLIQSLQPDLDFNKRRAQPPEGVMDRVYRDGVLALHHDPFSRLALVIQYWCGTRARETVDMNVYCVWEDPSDGGLWLTVPIGKSAKERLYPIVGEGMEDLLGFMWEIVSRQLHPEGTPHAGRPKAPARTNYRYLDSDRKQAMSWHYLFDRAGDPRASAQRRTRLSTGQLQDAMHNALILTARVDPRGLFRPETRREACGRRRGKDQLCGFFAWRDGITICPRCGGTLTGQRGQTCHRLMSVDTVCDGRAEPGAWFCARCGDPLAEFVNIGTHSFRHNNVSRNNRHKMPVALNMRLHGHVTMPMHLRYVHGESGEIEHEVRRVLVERATDEIVRSALDSPGRLVLDGVPVTPDTAELLSYALARGLATRTQGIWGGFLVGTLAEQGVAPPRPGGGQVVLPSDTIQHALAQYRYQALALAVSELALARGLPNRTPPAIPSFLDRAAVERLVDQHRSQVREYFASKLQVKLVERDIASQRTTLQDLENFLRPHYERLNLASIEEAVSAMAWIDDPFKRE